MGPEAALCNGVYGSEGNQSSALLAREVCSFNIILYMEYEFAMHVTYFPMVQAANLSYQLDSCQSTIKSSCFNETENLTMILLDECWPMVEQLESSTESCLSRWIKILPVFLHPGFKFCLSSSTQSCSCWESVKEGRQEFQRRCMNSSSPGETFSKLKHSPSYF